MDLGERFRQRGLVLGILAAVAIGVGVVAFIGRDDARPKAVATPKTASSAASASAGTARATAADSTGTSITSIATLASVVASDLPVKLPPTLPIPAVLPTSPTPVPPSSTTTKSTVAAPSASASTSTTTSNTAFDPSTGDFPWNYAVLKGAKLYLNGATTTKAQADAIKAAAAALLAPDRVVGSVGVDPQASGPSGVVRTDLNLDFVAGSDELSKAMTKDLDLVVYILQLAPKARLQLYGFTSNVGDAQVNLDLAARRLDSIVGYLTSHAVAEARLQTFPIGEDKPIADNNTPAGRAANDHTDLIFTNLLVG